jgi:hypothetical protein
VTIVGAGLGGLFLEFIEFAFLEDAELPFRTCKATAAVRTVGRRGERQSGQQPESHPLG